MVKILCTICARGGSKGVKNKNLKRINGIPLIVRTIKQANSLNIFENIVISTDSKKMENLATRNNVFSIGLRKKSLSGDNIPKIDAIRDAVNLSENLLNKKFDIIVDLDVSSPLRSNQDIKKAISNFFRTKSDNLITVCEARKNPYYNMLELNSEGKIKKVKKSKVKITSRQSAPQVFEMNASFYIWKKNILFSNSPFYRKKTLLYEMPFIRSIDIDSIHDFNLVESLLKANEKK